MPDTDDGQRDMGGLHRKVDELRVQLENHKVENTKQHTFLRNDHALMRVELERHGASEEKMEALLLGNGSAGMFERVRNVEKFCAQATWLIRIQLAAMTVGAGALVWQVLETYIREH